ncbi:TPA: hypothetical protein ACGJWD_004752 [Pseudomonas aeruginosa]|uniref:hypothetical protein n=1 Tax=Pseudomonas aeruginosa TaxID=287 RepID=UPI0012987FB6|nr:hypothetical protein [Pseudomonas aeruginosa]
MPDLSQEIVEDLAGRLRSHLSKKDGYGEIEFLNAGGSAAVYKVETPCGVRAYKVFDPKFVNDDDNSKEKQRLELQKKVLKKMILSRDFVHVLTIVTTSCLVQGNLDEISLSASRPNTPDALNAVTGAYFSSAYATNALAICMMSGFRWSAAQSIVIASPPLYQVHIGKRVSTYFG